MASPTGVDQFPMPVFRNMLPVDNINVNGVFYNLADTMDRLNWLAFTNRHYDIERVRLSVDTLRRIRNGQLTLIDPFTNRYRMMNDLVHEFNNGPYIAWDNWWPRYGCRSEVNARTPNEYIRLWNHFRHGATLLDPIDLTLSDSEDEAVLGLLALRDDSDYDSN